jgi:purine/pyrimidine-nucleoside phosphorylase
MKFQLRYRHWVTGFIKCLAIEYSGGLLPAVHREMLTADVHYSKLISQQRVNAIVFIGKGAYMSEFQNVTVVKKANVYFDGSVTSRTVIFPDGSRKTLGIMMSGEYEFSTAAKELMEVLAGKAEVLLPEEENWRIFSEGDSFEVKADSSFRIRTSGVLDYCCSYE